jgi:hypothetical protein
MEGYCFSAFLRIKQKQKLFIFPEHTPIELFKLPGDYSGEKYSPSLKIIRLFFNASMKPGTYTIKADLEGSSIESLSSEYYYNAAGPDILEDDLESDTYYSATLNLP